MAKQGGKSGHRHDWKQTAVTLQQKAGRVVGVSILWQCAGRRCAAETATVVVVRKPGANIRPRSESPLSAAEVKAAVQRGKDRLRERNAGSLAAMADEVDLDAPLTPEDFETPAGDGAGRKPRTVEESRAALGLYAPLEVSNG